MHVLAANLFVIREEEAGVLTSKGILPDLTECKMLNMGEVQFRLLIQISSIMIKNALKPVKALLPF